MEFIYAIINFLILAVLVILIGRKPIKAIFSTRRRKINEALDRAEELNAYIPAAPEIDMDAVRFTKEAEKQRISAIQAQYEEKQRQAAKKGTNTRLEMRREMLAELHNKTVARIIEYAKQKLTEEETVKTVRALEPAMVDYILSAVKLTPGDISYLRAHSVLYVTLTSAYTLPDELVKRIEEHTDNMLAAVNGKTSFWVRQDPQLLGGLTLRIGDTIYDCSVIEQLNQLKHRTEKDLISGNETAEDLINEIKANINGTENQMYTYQLGRVLTISDGICWMDGLADIMYGEVVEFVCGERGMVLDIQPERIGCVIFGKYEHIESGSRVRRVGRIASVAVGDALLGRVVDPLGHAIDGNGRIRTGEKRPIEFQAPAILDRAAVSEPLYTGIKAIDALVPIGKGQRELIIGDRQTGKTAIALDTIINQKGKNVICIYVAIGQKDTAVAEFRSKLEKYGALEYTTIVSASASASASLQYMAPFAGTAMGEYFMYKGRDVLIVYDDLSKHAVAYRELSLLLHRPSGREAYPGDIFYLHSRLLERSAKLSAELGGGSMTALPLIETLAGDISSYIPTNVISITDGQIFLDTELFREGQRPAVNVGLSVSRVGSAAQTKLMKQVSASLRMQLAQYRELSGFSQFGTDVDANTRKVLDSGIRMMTVLRQGRYSPLSDRQQAILIYAVSEGFADEVPVDALEEFESRLYPFFEERYPKLWERLDSGEKLDESTKSDINAALSEFAKEKLWQSLDN